MIEISIELLGNIFLGFLVYVFFAIETLFIFMLVRFGCDIGEKETVFWFGLWLLQGTLFLLWLNDILVFA